VKPPRATYSPDPPYPKKAHKPKGQNTVMLRLIVGNDGLPRNTMITRSLSPEFDKAAMDAVQTWKFEPATKDGKPVAVILTVEITFKH
jgi:TonB family protein